MANLNDWLESLAQIVTTRTGGTTVAKELNIPQIHDIIVRFLRQAKGGMSANLQLVHDRSWIVIIDGAGKVVYHNPVPIHELRLLLNHIRGLGVDLSKVSRIVVAKRDVIARLTSFAKDDHAVVLMRFNLPQSFPLETLDGQTIPKGSGRMLADCIVYLPRVFLVICGPGATGKSTLLNAIIQQVIMESQHHPISIAMYAGDATDVVVPGGVVFIPTLPPDDAVVALRSANARHIVIGETVSAATKEVVIRGLPAASGGATTTHGTIEEALAELPMATLLVEMNRLGERVVAVRAAYRETARDPLVELWKFDIAAGRFETNQIAMKSLWDKLQTIKEKYYQASI